MDKRDIVSFLLKQIESKQASTFFINGPPGAGKQNLMRNLASALPTYVSSTQVLGPYTGTIDSIISQINDDLFELRFLESAVPDGTTFDWYSNWVWLRDNLITSNRQNFFVLIQLDENDFNQYKELEVWFSSIRYMEHYWTSNKIRLQILVTGYWNHLGLEDYYHKISTSFPYTTSTNYIVWNEIPLNETLELVWRKIPSDSLLQPFGELIHEITGGYAGGITDVLEYIPSRNPTIEDVLFAAHQASSSGRNSKLLVNAWLQLPPGTVDVAKKIMLFQTLTSEDKITLDLLATAGIIKYQEVLHQTFASIKSWYVELLLRNNANTLGIDDDNWKMIQFDDFAPSIATFNTHGYKIINSIENMIRNFALTRLYEQDSADDHVLKNKVLKRKKSYISNDDDDAYERANEWRQKSERNGMAANLNPMITFTSTGDLVQLIREIAVSGDPLWKDISETIEKITPIRDAVMHNQLIDEQSLQSLYFLQTKVFTALNR